MWLNLRDNNSYDLAAFFDGVTILGPSVEEKPIYIDGVRLGKMNRYKVAYLAKLVLVASVELVEVDTINGGDEGHGKDGATFLLIKNIRMW
jgi:hypothetical protein